MYSTIPLFGQHNVVRFGSLRVWAENGLIKIENGKDNTYRSIDWKTAAERLVAIHEMTKRSAGDREHLNKFWDLLCEHQDVIPQLAAVIKQAREQGTPDDPSAVNDRKRRRPTSVVVPRRISSRLDLPL